MENYNLNFNINLIRDAVLDLAQELTDDYQNDGLSHFTLWDILKEMQNDSFLGLKEEKKFIKVFDAIHIERKPYLIETLEMVNNKGQNNSLIDKNREFYEAREDSQLAVDSRTGAVEDSIEKQESGEDLKHKNQDAVSELTEIEKIAVRNFLGDNINSVEELKYIANVASLIESYERPKPDLSQMKLNLLHLDDRTYKAIGRLESLHGEEFLSNGIEQFIIMSFSELGVYEESLVDLQRSVVDELAKISKGLVDYKNYQSSLIVPRSPDGLSLEELDQILIEDVDTFLDNLNEDDVEILEKRWGFVSEKCSLEDVGLALELTRERIRQRQAALEDRFIKSMRINSESLLRMIQPALNADITHNLPSLYQCFNSKKDFYYFLKLIMNFPNLKTYIHPKISKEIFNEFFAEQGAPIDKDEALEYLKVLNLKGIESFENALHQVEIDGGILIEGSQIWPCSLSKPQACACVLFDFPRGLPWSDVAKIVNNKSFSRTKVYEDRLDSVAFDSPEHIFLSGKGVYKHTNFIEVDEESVEKALRDLKVYAVSNGRSSFHLNEFYQSSPIKEQINYYELRHFVKHLGEEYGLFFDGRSQTDSIGLTKDIERITQVDVIITYMNDNEKLLTKTDIANLLKSKSLNHAAFYLDKMMKKGQVVQIDRMLYTTPEVAYKNIDVPSYLDAIYNILCQAGKPVEAEFFKEILNAKFSKDYSKSFYSSLARLYSEQKGWFRAYNIFSINEIPFSNISDLLTKVCKPEYTKEKNIELIKSQIAITNKVADVALNNWIHSVKYEGISSDVIN